LTDTHGGDQMCSPVEASGAGGGSVRFSSFGGESRGINVIIAFVGDSGVGYSGCGAV